MKARRPSAYVVPAHVIASIWDKIDQRGPQECWPWTLSRGSHGYGQVCWTVDGHSAGTTAHRVAWVAAGGTLDVGDTVDHTCRNRPCCNPAHLRVLTNVDNATDNGQGRKTQCPSGHPYDESNTYWTPKGHRRCRQCARERDQRAALVGAGR